MVVFKFGEYWDTLTFFLVLILGIVIYILTKIGAVRKKPFSFFLLFALLLFVYTFRNYTHGADTGTYVVSFRESLTFTNPINESYEPFFKIFTFLVRKITDNYNIYFLISGILICGSYIYFLKTFWMEKQGFLLTVLVAVEFFYDLNIMRYALAHSLFLISLCLLIKKKNLWAILLSLCSVLFHYTAIITLFFVLFYLLYIKCNKKKQITISVLLIFVMTAGAVAVHFLIGGTRYAKYFDTISPTLLGNWKQLFFGIIAFAYLLFIPNKTKKETIATVCGLFGLSLVPFVLINGAYRITYFFLIPEFYLLQTVIDRFTKKTIRLPWNILSAAFIVFYYLFDLSRRSQDYGFKYELAPFLNETITVFCITLFLAFLIMCVYKKKPLKKKYKKIIRLRKYLINS